MHNRTTTIVKRWYPKLDDKIFNVNRPSNTKLRPQEKQARASKKMAVALGLHIYYNVHYNVYWDESSSGFGNLALVYKILGKTKGTNQKYMYNRAFA